MDRHSPVHPLPEEIQQMGPSETVCRYCGVSYLVLHEFRRLQGKLRAVEQELERRRGSAEREQGLRDRLEELRAAHGQRAASLRTLGQQLDSARTHSAHLEQQLGRVRAKGRRLGRRSDAQQHCLMVALQLLASSRQDLRDVRQSFSRLQDVWKDCGTELLQSSRRSDAEQARRSQEADRLRTEASELHVRLEAQIRDSAALRSHNQEAQAQLDDMKELLESLQQDLRRHQSAREDLEELLERRCKEAEELRCRHTELEKQSGETHRRLSAEVKEREERLLSCRRQFRSLQEQLSLQRRSEQEAARRRNDTEAEKRALRDALLEARQEASRLRRHSEQETLVHQETVKKLEESVRRQVEEREALRTQVEAEAERDRARVVLREQELALERENNEGLRLKCQREKEQLQQQVAVRDAQERVLVLERRLREALEGRRGEEEAAAAARQTALERELQRLRHEEQQGALRLLRLQQELEEQRQETWKLQEQNTLLQETVRRECEEREELTTALTDAREQLSERRATRTRPARPEDGPDLRGPQGPRAAVARRPLLLPRLPRATW